ncbi:MAG: hypothetical protein SF029_16540 [bacterium]|nr:hypothetical protein [bacterium]
MVDVLDISSVVLTNGKIGIFLVGFPKLRVQTAWGELELKYDSATMELDGGFFVTLEDVKEKATQYWDQYR